MAELSFWLALAVAGVPVLAYALFARWAVGVLIEWMEGESEGPVSAGPQVKQAKKGA